MAIDKATLLAKAKATAPDMNKAVVGGESGPSLHEMVPEGVARCRFVGYIEIGKQKQQYKGDPQPKIEDQVILAFEISGPKVKPREDGKPHIIELRPMKKSLNEKAKFFKIFQRLNYAGTATHIAELLGQGYLTTVYHRTYKGNDGKDHVAVDLNKKGELIELRPPRFEDPETGEIRSVAVDPAKGAERLFLWDHADLEQWASIFVEGEYPERKNEAGEVTSKARSKNVVQAKIKAATNFRGSPIYTVLASNGQSIDIPEAEVPTDDDEDETLNVPGQRPATEAPWEAPSGQAADDLLNGVV